MDNHVWYIWSNEHMAWWCLDGFGYTKDPRLAGLYTYEDAQRICNDANISCKGSVLNEYMIHKSDVEKAFVNAK